MRSLCSLALLAACTFDSPKLGVDGAPPDGGGEWTVVETLMVPVRGETVTSKRVLQQGVGYRLRASGTAYVALQTLGDAEYYNFNNGSPVDGAVNIDVGLAVNDSTIDATRTPRWGAYTDTHVYEVDWTGDGAPIVAQFHDGNTANNDGMLTLEILALQ
ncbi:MAG TPA: hypothetical protein VK932_00975 [Kofleriaceae bacterium]|nr:hypothetical protein [Kofleriaceae bacterium]